MSTKRQKINTFPLIVVTKTLYLLRSAPERFVLEFPMTTPSGFTIGIIKNINASLSYFAAGLSLHKN